MNDSISFKEDAGEQMRESTSSFGMRLIFPAAALPASRRRKRGMRKRALAKKKKSCNRKCFAIPPQDARAVNVNQDGWPYMEEDPRAWRDVIATGVKAG